MQGKAVLFQDFFSPSPLQRRPGLFRPGPSFSVLPRYSLLRSRSQLGSERILIPETIPMAANMVTMDDPP